MDMTTKLKLIGLLMVVLGLPVFVWYREKLTAPMFSTIVFFVVIYQLFLVFNTPWPKKIAWIGMLAGAILNQVAVWSNGSRMPVKGGLYPHGIWRPMVESDRLKFLCDIYWNSTSIGDLFVFGSMILALLMALARVE